MWIVNVVSIEHVFLLYWTKDFCFFFYFFLFISVSSIVNYYIVTIRKRKYNQDFAFATREHQASKQFSENILLCEHVAVWDKLARIQLVNIEHTATKLYR